MVKLEIGKIYKCKDLDSNEIVSLEQIVSIEPELKSKTLAILNESIEFNYQIGEIARVAIHALVELTKIEKLIYS
jgi:hypothetical protein